MAKNKGMCFYYDWIEPLREVPSKDFKKLVIAMLECHKDGTEPPKFTGVTGIIAGFIFPQIQRSKEFAEKGSKGGKSTRNFFDGSTDKLSYGSTVASTENALDGSTVASTLNINKTKHKQNIDETIYTPPTPSCEESGDRGGKFDRFWNAYPKKVGKKDAQAVFSKLGATNELVERMLSAIETQRQSEQWRREGGRFIPNPATWLRQGRWDDEPTESAVSETDTDNVFLTLYREESKANEP